MNLANFLFFFLFDQFSLLIQHKTQILLILERVVIFTLCSYISTLIGAKISKMKVNFTSLFDIKTWCGNIPILEIMVVLVRFM